MFNLPAIYMEDANILYFLCYYVALKIKVSVTSKSVLKTVA